MKNSLVGLKVTLFFTITKNKGRLFETASLCFYANEKRRTNLAYPQYSSDTLNFFLPLARRDANTRRPLAVAILERNPCLFFLFLLDGWKVLFIIVIFLILLFVEQIGWQR